VLCAVCIATTAAAAGVAEATATTATTAAATNKIVCRRVRRGSRVESRGPPQHKALKDAVNWWWLCVCRCV
jgi:hypothetical protein